MERRITEEVVTKKILNWLKSNWRDIICFDFPQSGTWYVLQINNDLRVNKGQDIIIPDIVALKSWKCVFFENKNRFVLADFEKVNKLKTTNNYSESIDKLLCKYNITDIYYGVWLPLYNESLSKIDKYLDLVDFVVVLNLSNQDERVEVLFQSNVIFN
jgi:hypothetical protein